MSSTRTRTKKASVAMASITEKALSPEELLTELLRGLSMDGPSYIEEYECNVSGAVPGICCEPDCLAIADDCEPDMRDGNCMECGAKATVRSGFVLMGVI